MKRLPTNILLILAFSFILCCAVQAQPQTDHTAKEAHKHTWKRNELLMGLASVSVMCVLWYALRRKKKSNTSNIDML